MATHAASTRNISGLARALAQHGLMTEYEAEALQTQAQQAGVTLRRARPRRQADHREPARGLRVARLRRAAARPRRRSTLDQFQKDLIDLKIAQARHVLPLHKRGNRLYVATSDPANLQAPRGDPVQDEPRRRAGRRRGRQARRGDPQARRGVGRAAEGRWRLDGGPRGRPPGGRRPPGARRRGKLRGRGRAGRPLPAEDPDRRDRRRRLRHPLRALREVLPRSATASTAS